MRRPPDFLRDDGPLTTTPMLLCCEEVSIEVAASRMGFQALHSTIYDRTCVIVGASGPPR